MRPSPYSMRRLGPALAALVVVGELDLPGGLVVQGDVGDVGVEGLAHLLADELDQRVEVELRRERLADAVHRRQLADALARLLHEPRVLERDGEAARQRRQEPLVVLVERVLAVDVLERDHAGRLAARDERDEQDRLGPLAGHDACCRTARTRRRGSR